MSEWDDAHQRPNAAADTGRMTPPTRLTSEDLWRAYLSLCGWTLDAWAAELAAMKEGR